MLPLHGLNQLDLIPVVAVSGDERNFLHLSAGRKTSLFIDKENQIDRRCDQSLLRRMSGFCDETLQAHEATHRVISVDRGHAPGMAGVPRLQQCMRLGATYFADNNPRWLEAHTGSQTIEHRNRSNGAQVYIIAHRALKPRGVLD